MKNSYTSGRSLRIVRYATDILLFFYNFGNEAVVVDGVNPEVDGVNLEVDGVNPGNDGVNPGNDGVNPGNDGVKM